MKIVVTGSRNWLDRATIRRAFEELGGPHHLIHGAARGADQIAASVAAEMGWTVEPVPAKWETHGRAAGPIRNREMLDMEPNFVIAFPLPGSVGTWDCVNEAKRRGIPGRIVKAK